MSPELICPGVRKVGAGPVLNSIPFPARVTKSTKDTEKGGGGRDVGLVIIKVIAVDVGSGESDCIVMRSITGVHSFSLILLYVASHEKLISEAEIFYKVFAEKTVVPIELQVF
ncbi:hypothetical protein Tco_1462872 [Tanacetum coccineum]